MKLSGLPVLSSLQRNKGAVNWMDTPNGPVARMRHHGHKLPRSEADQVARNTFKMACYMMKYGVGESLIAAQEIAHGRALFPRDVLMSAMYGDLYAVDPTNSDGSNGLYDLLSTVVVPVGDGPIQFSGIPQSYLDLVVSIWGRGAPITGTGGDIRIRFNNDSSAIYNDIVLLGNVSSSGVTQHNNQTAGGIARLPWGTTTAAMAGMAEIVIPFYTNTSWNKVWNAEWMAPDGTSTNLYTGQFSGVYRSTNPITQIDLIGTGSPATFKAGTIATLWGRV